MIKVERSTQLANLREHFHMTQQELAANLGISRQHLSKLENSTIPLSAKIIRAITGLCKKNGVAIDGITNLARMVPVRSWAQAGIGRDFDELPFEWQRTIPTDCPDEAAFAVEIQGDSMEPKILAGDIAIVMPSLQPKSGTLVVARLETEGVVLKIYTSRQTTASRHSCIFTSYNSVYQPIEVPETAVMWNYPVYQIIRQAWR